MLDPTLEKQTDSLSRVVRRAATLASVILVVCTSALRSEAPSPPPYFAVENARVVVGTGEILENVTVLVEDGLIAGVGQGVDVPADAWRIDGAGLTVFPGFIDALTGHGLAGGDDSSSEGGGGPGGGGGPTIEGPEDRPQTTPWVRAADQLGAVRNADKWREAGFTSAVTAPSDGIFPGQAAFIHLGEAEPSARVVAPSIAQRIRLESSGGFRTYPSSLMGIFSYVEQVFADVDHYEASLSRYRASALGRERPGFDRALDPLAAARADRHPFLIPAQPGREIDRALALADRIGVRPILYGGHGAYERVDRLAEASVPLIVRLDWPEAASDRDPEADTPLPELYHRRMSPAVPSLLADRGIPFAFSSGGQSASEVLEAIQSAVTAGLSNEDALSALTRDAAAIFGLEDRLGTVEAGKIANLVLATDYPWSEDAEVRALFVDGMKYELAEEDEPKEAPASDVTGTWAMTLQTPGGAVDLTAELEMDDDGGVDGEIDSDRGTTSVDDGSMSGELLRFETTREMGGREMTSSWSLTVEGESLSGSMSAGPMSMDVSGERTVAAVGGSAGEEGDADEDVPIGEIEEVMALYRGAVRELDRYAITNATVWTLAGDPIENGSVLVENGKIAAVGAGLTLPDGVEVIDAGGGALIPGIVDAHAHIAIEGGVNEGTLAVTAMAGVADVINPDDIAIYRALAGGVTTVNLLHGSANPIGGQNAVAKLRWGSGAEAMKFEGAPAGIKFALGENPKRSNFSNPAIPDRYPKTRMGVMDVIRQAFVEADRYRSEWQAYEAGLAASSNRRRRNAEPQPEAPRRDLALEALAEILDGDRLVHSHCYRADEILQLLRLAEEFGFRVGTLQHVLEGYKVADEIAAHGAGASTFSDWWGFKIEAYDAIPHNAALMTERGVLVSINSDSGEEMRHLNQEAAKAVKWGGLSEVEALALVTLNPARQLGIDERVGSIEVGKDADLVLYDGHPLSMLSVVLQTFVDGDLYFDRVADARRQAKIEEIKLRILGGDDEEGEGAGVEGEADAEEVTDDPESPSRETGAYWTVEHTYSCREEH